VELDAHNAEAMTDLGEFYSEARSCWWRHGQSTTIAAKLDRIDPVRAHELKAAIAKQNHDLDGRTGVAAGDFIQRPSSATVDETGSFFRKYKRWDEMESAIQSGMTALSATSIRAWRSLMALQYW